MLEEVGHFVLIIVSVDDMEAWVALDDTGYWLVVWLAEVFPKMVVTRGN